MVEACDVAALKIYTDKIKPMKVHGDMEATTEERRK